MNNHLSYIMKSLSKYVHAILYMLGRRVKNITNDKNKQLGIIAGIIELTETSCYLDLF